MTEGHWAILPRGSTQCGEEDDVTVRMIPDVLLHTSSAAEAKLFDILQASRLGETWTAYHSLNCSEHAYKRWAEIDFLIVGPDAILVLEVKGGRVQCKDGLWTYMDRFGRTRTNSEGPYGQAKSAMYALRKLLSDRYHLEAIVSGRTPFGFGVVFPDIDWDIDTPECPATITADREMVFTAPAATRYLKHLIAYWREKHANASPISPAELKQLRAKLRPDVDIYPPLSQRIGATVTNLQHLTEEQYERLEFVEQNERALVTGGAGTGKTFLLVQFARRCAARRARVLIVVQSPTLAAHLRVTVSDPLIAISSFDAMKALPRDPADVLLVDEGQDLLNMDALAELSERVRGGLDEGRWCWFMDPNNQTGVDGTFDPEALVYLQSGLTTGRPIKLPLLRNCRNTKEIVRQVQLWTGADIGVTEVSGFGTQPSMIQVAGLDEAATELALRVRELLDGGAEPGDIGLITDDDTEPVLFHCLPTSVRRLLTPLTVATVATELKGRIVWGSAARFKGLERPIVFVLAMAELPYDERKSSLYVSLTRANYGLWVLARSSLVASLVAAERQHLSLVGLQDGHR